MLATADATGCQKFNDVYVISTGVVDNFVGICAGNAEEL